MCADGIRLPPGVSFSLNIVCHVNSFDNVIVN
jgi:hypothetical protein